MATNDQFAGFQGGTYPHGLDAPAMHAAAVTPNDSTDLTTASRSLYIGVAGDVTLDTVGGETSVLFKAVPAGTVLPVRASRVRSTGTTATNITAMW